ncbi:nickel-type superoxide dismutase maturation protease [Actinomadura mexicana]|uniref:Nickel-type superoxide dismutase maturation protease n=1 Tax=Actinomadura mexicana TaxID=134959 RepID=A0A239BC09_9ACTN|nr:nickel-type superoxide dismutase maturation protease [Actinomadura mexicana]SNS05535.1 nickel-type superoxide dismutase maturation protease [Actinomadura mexicana]
MRIRTPGPPVLWGLAGAAALALAAARRPTAVEVTGDSMLPGLRPGDWLVVLPGARPAPGDVVVAEHPERRGLLIVKRVAHRSADGWWLESDNQRAPGRQDSWTFGPVPDTLLRGRVIARYWPPPPKPLRPVLRTGARAGAGRGASVRCGRRPLHGPWRRRRP